MLHTYVEATLHGVVIVLTTYFVLPKCTFGTGFLYNNYTENIIILIQIVFTPIIRVLLFRERFLKWHDNLIAIVSHIFVYIISIAIMAYLVGQPVVPQFYRIFLSYDCAVLVINTLLFNIALSYILKVVLSKELPKVFILDNQ
jgi:predicted Na+-dependent transporter